MAASTTTDLDGAREALTSVCGRVGELEEASDGVDGVRPGLVAGPTDVDQVAAVMRVCSERGLSVVPRGRGTKLTWGTPPASADVLLDLSALDRVLDHQAGDLILATQAGVRLADVQSVAAEGGQRLTLDETVPGGSVGGMLATNASGPRRQAVGTARDLLIGITVVRHDGVVAKAGGRVVKNVAGYDLGKLFVGSFGTLGVIVDATFRLHPVPAATRWVSAAFDSPARAHELVQAAVHSQVVPAAVELEQDEQGGRVHVLLEGRPDGVAGRTEALRALLGPDATDAEEAPAGGAAYPWDLAATGDERDTALKTTFALSGLPDVLGALGDVDGLRLRGSAGVGVLYAALPHRTAPADVAAAVERLREVCGRHGGSAVVVDAPAAVKDAVDPWGPVPALALMRRVKEQFDPDHRLSPGRFVGGI